MKGMTICPNTTGAVAVYMKDDVPGSIRKRVQCWAVYERGIVIGLVIAEIKWTATLVDAHSTNATPDGYEFVGYRMEE